MAITPDTKDWTWVLERPCKECGTEAADYDPAAGSAFTVRTLAQYMMHDVLHHLHDVDG